MLADPLEHYSELVDRWVFAPACQFGLKAASGRLALPIAAGFVSASGAEAHWQAVERNSGR
jgi:hypothetical protein